MRTDHETTGTQPGLSEDDLAYLGRMTRWLSRDAQEAEDIAQETWLAFHKSPPHESNRNRQWLRVVARRIAARMRYRRDPAHSLVEEPIDPETSRNETRRDDIQDIVGGAFRSLPEPYQSTVRMRFYEDLKPAHISERLGVSVNTVNSRLQRAQVMLRRKLEPERRGALNFLAGIVCLPFGGRSASGRGWSFSASTQIAVVGFALIGVGTFLGLRLDGRDFDAAQATPTAGLVVASRLEAIEPSNETQRTPLNPVESAPATAVTNVSGRVYDAQGRSLQGAAIYAWIDANDARRVATTGPDGTFRAAIGEQELLRAPIVGAQGSIALQARVAGLGHGTVRILPPGTTHDIPLVLGALSAEILVDLRSPAGERLTDARVEYSAESADIYGPEADGTLFWDPPTRAVLQPDGTWLIAGVPLGSGTVRAWVRGYALARHNLPVEIGRTVERVICQPGLEVVGRVIDERGRPVPGVAVVRTAHKAGEEQRSFTDADGRFRLQELHPGRARLQVEGALTWADTFELAELKTDLGDLTVTASETMRFRLVDELGAPLSAFFVQLRSPHGQPSWTKTMHTDADGWATVENAPYDTLAVWPFAGDLHPGAGFPLGVYEIQRGEESTLALPLSEMTTWECWSGSTPGVAPAGSLLRIRQLPTLAERRLRLPPDGRMRLRLPGGQYFVTYFLPGKGEAIFGVVDVRKEKVSRFYPPSPGRVVLPADVQHDVLRTRLEQRFLINKSDFFLLLRDFESAPETEYELLEGSYRLTLWKADGSQDELSFDVASAQSTYAR